MHVQAQAAIILVGFPLGFQLVDINKTKAHS